MSSDLAVMTCKHPALHQLASTAYHAARLRSSFGGWKGFWTVSRSLSSLCSERSRLLLSVGLKLW